MNRRRPAHRLTSALIGAIITSLGVLTGALLSGRDLDTELIAIVTLASVGGWLLITALLSSRSPRQDRWRDPAPVYSAESLRATEAASDATPGTPDAPLTAAARTAATKAKRSGNDSQS